MEKARKKLFSLHFALMQNEAKDQGLLAFT
jgi:hypothetical protein